MSTIQNFIKRYYIKVTCSNTRFHKYNNNNYTNYTNYNYTTRQFSNNNNYAMRVYLIAGEPSGDVIGANLIESLKKQTNNNSIEFSGVGGERMIQAGLSKSIISIDNIAVMGTIELISKIYNLNKCVNKVVDDIIDNDPDVIVAIDAKGFNKAVLKRYYKKKYGKADRQLLQNDLPISPTIIGKKISPPPPIVQYVAPSYWAYKSSSKDKPKELLKHFNKIYHILPFEGELLNENNVPNLYVGHSAVEEMMKLFHNNLNNNNNSRNNHNNFNNNNNDSNNFLLHLRKNIDSYRENARIRFKIDDNNSINKIDKVLLLFPGSRLQEVDKSLPLIYDMLKKLLINNVNDDNITQKYNEKWTIIIPTLSVNTPVGKKVAAFVNNWKQNHKNMPYVNNIIYVNNDDVEMKRDSFAAADVAIAMSGTVVTELALANIKTLVIYPGSMITGMLAKQLAKVKYVSIPNIMTNRLLIDELLFDNCTVENLTTKAESLLFNFNISKEKEEEEEEEGKSDKDNNTILDDCLLSLLNHNYTMVEHENRKIVEGNDEEEQQEEKKDVVHFHFPSDIAANDILKLGNDYIFHNRR